MRLPFQPLIAALALSTALSGAAVAATTATPEESAPPASATASSTAPSVQLVQLAQIIVPNDWKRGDTATYRFIQNREEQRATGTGRVALHWLLDIEVLEASDKQSVHRWSFRVDPDHPQTQAAMVADPLVKDMLNVLTVAKPEMVVDDEGTVTAVRNLPALRQQLLALIDRITSEGAKAGTSPEQLEGIRKSAGSMFGNDSFLTEQFIREARALYMFGGGVFEAGAQEHFIDKRVTPIGNITLDVAVDSRIGAMNADGTLPFHSVESVQPISGDQLKVLIAEMTRGAPMTPQARRQLDQQLAGLQTTMRIDTQAVLKDGSPWPPSMSRSSRVSADGVTRTDTNRLELVSSNRGS